MDKGTTNVIQAQIPQVVCSLDELAREGARRMIAEALELEVEEYIEQARSISRLRALTTDDRIIGSRARSCRRICDVRHA